MKNQKEGKKKNDFLFSCQGRPGEPGADGEKVGVIPTKTYFKWTRHIITSYDGWTQSCEL